MALHLSRAEMFLRGLFLSSILIELYGVIRSLPRKVIVREWVETRVESVGMCMLDKLHFRAKRDMHLCVVCVHFGHSARRPVSVRERLAGSVPGLCRRCTGWWCSGLRSTAAAGNGRVWVAYRLNIGARWRWSGGNGQAVGWWRRCGGSWLHGDGSASHR